MPRYNEYVVEKVAEAMEDASWSGAVKARMQGCNIAIAIEWADLARAALSAIDSLYESEAEEPVEYAGIEGGL